MDMFRLTSIPKYEKSLDILADRQRVIGQNVANITTPGYKTKDIAFREELADAMAGGEDASSGYDPRAVSAELSAYDRMEAAVLNHSTASDPATREALAEIRALRREAMQDSDSDDSEVFVVDEDGKAGVNDVEMEAEMSKLSETGILYQAFVALARKRFKQVESAIRESV